MADPVSTHRQGDVAVLRIDNPPVNALDAGVRRGLAEAVARAAADDAVRAIVLACAGRTFVAGADIAELERAAWRDDDDGPDLHPLLALVESCPKPVVAAIHGTALGGGLELAMACHWRLAAAGARLGVPEINLGIIPGGEGTQRLPRLVGVARALDMGLGGKPISAADALAAGLVDGVVDGELEVEAVAFARDLVARGTPPRRTCDRVDRIGTVEQAAPLIDQARETVRRTKPHLPAARALVDAVEAAVALPFDAGVRRERALSAACVRSEPCRALLHVFLAERAVARVPGVPRETAALPVERVAIVGAGTMGGGIAMACANVGIPVILRDATSEALDAGMAAVRRSYDASVARGRLTPDAVAERLARITPQLGWDGVDEADLVVEAVYESLELKRRVFAELDGVARPGAVLATNTSTLDVDAIAAATSRPGMVVGLHFFSPAHVMRLLEIVRGADTRPDVVATALALAKRLGKVGVVVRNLPGFVGNRMMFPYMYETQFLVEEGATPEQVDRALTRFGMAMGMFAVDDMAGLDVAWRVRQELGHFRDAAVRRPLVADRLVAMGRIGQKRGAGWYRYDGGRAPISDPEVLALIERTASEAGIARRAVGDDEIVERSILALVNEGARVLGDGGAARASDLDVVYVNGYGFPAWRGGPMFHADRLGLGGVYERVVALHREHGARWAPAPLLAQLAAEGRTFRELDADRARDGEGDARRLPSPPAPVPA